MPVVRDWRRPGTPQCKWFTPALIVELSEVVGPSASRQLLPLLDKAADLMHRRLQGEQNNNASRKQARHHAKAAKQIEKLTGRLVMELKKHGPVIREAVFRSDLPVGYDPSSPRSLGSWGLPSPAYEPRQPVGDICATLAALARDAREWEETARVRSKGKRGRPAFRERLKFASWLGNLLAEREIPLIKSRDSAFACVLGLLYKAAGIPKPTDLYRDVAAALDDPVAYRRADGTLMALPRPPRKPLHKSKRRRRIV